MIDKNTFVQTIENLRSQIHYDNKHNLRHNSVLIKSIINLLRIHFPKDEDNFCHIEHYCFHLNFGKLGNELLISTEDFYDELILKTQTA